MYGIYSTQIQPDTKKAVKQCEMITGEKNLKYFISTPGHYSTRLEGDNIKTISILAKMREASLDGVFLQHPYRLFKDDFSLSFINHLSQMVKPSGQLILPYTSKKMNSASQLLDLPWLEKHLGKCIKNYSKEKVASFSPLRKKIEVSSILEAITSKLHDLTQKQKRGVSLNSESLSVLSKFIINEDIKKLEAFSGKDSDDLIDVQSFLSFATYSIFGASYKTQSINKFMSQFFVPNKPIKILDIGGGLGFVDIELLLSNKNISKLINCEPTRSSVPVNKFLFEYFSNSIDGRYSLRIEKIENFIPHEKLDVVCDFAALLYVPRSKLEFTLNRLWDQLNENGIFVIHENIKRSIFKDKPYYDQVFEARELDDILSQFGKVSYFRSSDFKEISKSDTKDLTVFRVVRKRSENANS